MSECAEALAGEVRGYEVGVRVNVLSHIEVVAAVNGLVLFLYRF